MGRKLYSGLAPQDQSDNVLVRRQLEISAQRTTSDGRHRTTCSLLRIRWLRPDISRDALRRCRSPIAGAPAVRVGLPSDDCGLPMRTASRPCPWRASDGRSVPGTSSRQGSAAIAVWSSRRLTSMGGSGEGGVPGAFVNQALKPGSNRNYPETVPFGSSSDLK